MQEVNECLCHLGETILPGVWLINIYPVLRFVPGYLRTLRRWHQIELRLFRREMEGVRKEVVCIALILTTQIFLMIKTHFPCAYIYTHTHTHTGNRPHR